MGQGLAMEKMSWIFLEWRRFLQKRLHPYGVSIQQYSLLCLLAKQGALCPSQVAEWLHCDRPTATVVIKNLEKRGFLVRETNKDNGKYVWARLTPAGHSCIDDIRRTLPELSGHPFDVLSDQEINQLDHMLSRVKSRVKELTGENNTGDDQ